MKLKAFFIIFKGKTKQIFSEDESPTLIVIANR